MLHRVAGYSGGYIPAATTGSTGEGQVQYMSPQDSVSWGCSANRAWIQDAVVRRMGALDEMLPE